jgi:hypothetical protein
MKDHSHVSNGQKLQLLLIAGEKVSDRLHTDPLHILDLSYNLLAHYIPEA